MIINRTLCTFLLASVALISRASEVTVTVDKVRETTFADPQKYAGLVEAVEQVDIMPRVTGELRKINFIEGETVKKGDLLFELEDTTYQAAVAALEARKEQLTSQVDFLTREFKRYQELIVNKAVAVSTYDRAIFELNAARAQLKEVEASLINARNNLSYTRIAAPITGRIGKSTFSTGNLITPGGKKLAGIEMISPIRVRFAVSESALRREFGGRDGIIKNGVIRIRLADNREYSESAKITLVDNRINQTTNTISVWAEFSNRDHQLIPGGFVTVSLSNKNRKKHTALLPSAIIIGNGTETVFVVGKDNRVSSRRVTTGKLSGKYQIITSGVTPGESVVVEGSHKLRDGMSVKTVTVK